MKDIQTKNIYYHYIHFKNRMNIGWILIFKSLSSIMKVPNRYDRYKYIIIFRYWVLRDSGQDKGNSLDILDNDKIKDEKMRK